MGTATQILGVKSTCINWKPPLPVCLLSTSTSEVSCVAGVERVGNRDKREWKRGDWETEYRAFPPPTSPSTFCACQAGYLSSANYLSRPHNTYNTHIWYDIYLVLNNISLSTHKEWFDHIIIVIIIIHTPFNSTVTTCNTSNRKKYAMANIKAKLKPSSVDFVVCQVTLMKFWNFWV